MSKTVATMVASVIIGLICCLVLIPMYRTINKWEVSKCEEKGGKAIVKYTYGIPYDTYCQLGE